MKKLTIAALAACALVTTAHAASQQDVALAKSLFKYYSEHLPEAQKVTQACVAKGFDKVQGEEKIKCVAARDAWHFQPYKPTPPKFSSKGGTH